MRKMLTEDLEYFMNMPDKPNQKLTKKQISRIEDKENFIAYCNQYSHIYMRYVELQESNKMSSKHNTSKNLLFSNLPSNIEFKSFKVGDLMKQNSNTYTSGLNYTLDKFTLLASGGSNQMQSKMQSSNLNNFQTHISQVKKLNTCDSNSNSKMKYGINFVNNYNIESINKEVIGEMDHIEPTGTDELNMNSNLNINFPLIRESSSLICNSNNNSNMIPISIKREMEEEQELKKKIKEIANRRNVKGLTSIHINRENRKILVNSMSNTQYIYDCLYWDRNPPVELKGHKSSYCVNSVLNPNADYVLSGSKDANIYIWNVDKKNNLMKNNMNSEPIKLSGFHNLEIGAVDWGRNNENFIASACDNGIVLIWDDK
jgi:WD40 repeat protein